jgi:protein arginine kinase
MFETRFDQSPSWGVPWEPPHWMAEEGPEASVAVWCQCSLVRNLADFAFPETCSGEDKTSVEQRVLSALRELNLCEEGRYYPLSDLSRAEVLCLAECRLIPYELTLNGSHGGVYVTEDRSTSIAVNGADHLCITALASGCQVQEVWSRLTVLDDRLAGKLDYAFDKRLGFLTTSLGHAGTGLKESVVLHLPALVMLNGMANLVQAARQRRQAIHGFKSVVSPVAAPLAPGTSPGEGSGENALASNTGDGFYMDLTGALYGDVAEAEGDLFMLTNLATLGVSEEEILFHLRHAASDIIAQERAARESLLMRESKRLEDRVWRAVGIAQNARVIGFTESVGLWSSLRLGIETGLLSEHSLRELDELLFASQGGHTRMRSGRDCDEWMLGIERADLLRARFRAA